jgi:hypothetical protein
MKLGKILTGALALAALGYVARIVILSAADWQRYDKIREMSNEGPFAAELPAIAAETARKQSATAREFAAFMTHAPYEFARYLRALSL